MATMEETRTGAASGTAACPTAEAPPRTARRHAACPADGTLASFPVPYEADVFPPPHE